MRDEFTAAGLREVATDEYGTYIVHRHEGEHGDGADCWCHPLVLRHAQLFLLSLDELQELLDAHYRIH